MRHLLILWFVCSRLSAELSGSYLLPLDHEAIQYSKLPLSDPVARLRAKLERGETKLAWDEEFGYLRSLLRELKIPIESQVLVFSKTSFQAPRISPRTPRAIYFNDTVSVGMVRGGEVLEIASQDPKQGVIFYTLDLERSENPRFERRDTCLQCHASGGTLGVPGLVVRSVYPEPTGMPAFHAGGFITDHRSPLAERWGGWYVTGKHGSQRHLGNAVARNRDKPQQLEMEGTQNVLDLRDKFDTGAYLSPSSDIVALMVLEHLTHMTNLITRVGFETRLALHYQAGINKAFGRPAEELSESTRRRIDSAVEEMVDYMLFVDEAPLVEPVQGSNRFAEVFNHQGPRDSKGRSLRDFDLRTRLFRYPLSFMIYSEAFDQMPGEARERVLRRLFHILKGKDPSPKYRRLTAEQRQAIFEILLETKPNLPSYWRLPQTAASSLPLRNTRSVACHHPPVLPFAQPHLKQVEGDLVRLAIL
ncbi:MAG: hypothetical protein NZV14_04845 [Bryobacteraceae bacterium]|nr:hypothetical protein [Bryobacteraceae bacterium]MDW8377462.1 hypothetical protein [Bryobacterales bacterium]